MHTLAMSVFCEHRATDMCVCCLASVESVLVCEGAVRVARPPGSRTSRATAPSFQT